MTQPTERDAALEQQVTRVLRGTAGFKAPQNLESLVLARLDERARVPWWQRRVQEWPAVAQLIFALTGIAAAVAVLFGRTAGVLLGASGTVLQRPAADLNTTLSVLGIVHRVADTLAGALPQGLWYGGIALCIAAYLALFFLLVFGYRLLQAPAHR